MSITLYDLAGADPAHRFSPYCWRTRLALAHKQLDHDTIAWRFCDKAALGFSGQDKVPVLVDGDRIVCDSTVIADYLEATYPDRPSLFGGEGGRRLTDFIMRWIDDILSPGIARAVVSDICQHLTPADQIYFRQTREARFGMTLEAVTADRESRLPGFRQALSPLRKTLQQNAYLGGERPLYADYAVFGTFQWARTVSRFELLAEEDPIAAWRERMLDLHGGLARQALCYPLGEG